MVCTFAVSDFHYQTFLPGPSPKPLKTKTVCSNEEVEVRLDLASDISQAKSLSSRVCGCPWLETKTIGKGGPFQIRGNLKLFENCLPLLHLHRNGGEPLGLPKETWHRDGLLAPQSSTLSLALRLPKLVFHLISRNLFCHTASFE